MASEYEPTPPATLQGKINRLFEVCRPSSEPGRQWQNKEVVVAAVRASGREISESHISELRRGIKDNPTIRVLDAIAWFFQVRLGYFTDPQAAAEVEADLLALEAQLRAELAVLAELAGAEWELRQALTITGVTGVAQRGGATTPRDRIAMIRLLLDVLQVDSGSGDNNPPQGPRGSRPSGRDSR